MATKLNSPTRISSAGNKHKIIEEYIGRVNSDTTALSIAKMNSPSGWNEPGQKPEFDEFTIVFKGMLKVKTIDDEFEINAGEAIIVNKNEWVQYSSPGPDGAEYIAVCLPAFSPETVHRDG